MQRGAIMMTMIAAMVENSRAVSHAEWDFSDEVPFPRDG